VARRIGATTGLHLPGTYRRLLADQCPRATAPDARLYLVMDAEEWTATKHDAAVRATALFDQALAAGEAITVERWRLGGMPEVRACSAYRDQSAQAFTVDADDVIRPA